MMWGSYLNSLEAISAKTLNQIAYCCTPYFSHPTVFSRSQRCIYPTRTLLLRWLPSQGNQLLETSIAPECIISLYLRNTYARVQIHIVIKSSKVKKPSFGFMEFHILRRSESRILYSSTTQVQRMLSRWRAVLVPHTIWSGTTLPDDASIVCTQYWTTSSLISIRSHRTLWARFLCRGVARELVILAIVSYFMGYLGSYCISPSPPPRTWQHERNMRYLCTRFTFPRWRRQPNTLVRQVPLGRENASMYHKQTRRIEDADDPQKCGSP